MMAGRAVPEALTRCSGQACVWVMAGRVPASKP